MDCMRKPKKASSNLNHRWFYSYGKPLRFLSGGLYEKTQKGFISKPLKLLVIIGEFIFMLSTDWMGRNNLMSMLIKHFYKQ